MRPMRRVLAAVDFSERSRVALGFAARLAYQFTADLHVVHAQEPLLAAAAAHHGLDLARDSEDELRAFVAHASPATRCAVHLDVLVGPAATSIIDVAERTSCDIIIMAAHGMSAVQHAVVGSTTEGVLRRSTVSVLVVPDEWTAAAPQAPDLTGHGPVIVGIDLQMPAFEAAADAAVFARALGSERILLHVVPSITVLPRWRTQAEAALAARVIEARSELRDLVTRLDDDVPTRVLVERGRVAACVADVARQYPRGIVAVGRSVHPRGYGLPGRTAYRILAETQLPVWMHAPR